MNEQATDAILAEARREGYEAARRQAAGIAETEPEYPGEPPERVQAWLDSVGPAHAARESCRITKKRIAESILAMQPPADAEKGSAE